MASTPHHSGSRQLEFDGQITALAIVQHSDRYSIKIGFLCPTLERNANFLDIGTVNCIRLCYCRNQSFNNQSFNEFYIARRGRFVLCPALNSLCFTKMKIYFCYQHNDKWVRRVVNSL